MRLKVFQYLGHAGKENGLATQVGGVDVEQVLPTLLEPRLIA